MRNDFLGRAKSVLPVLAVALLQLTWALAQDAPARKPTSPEEYQEFLAVAQAPDPARKIELTEQFLTKYPESEYLARVHYYVTYAFSALAKHDKVIEHGAKGMAFQKDPNILSLMADAYAGQKKNDEAIAMASEALAATDSFARPENVTAEDWDKRMKTLRGANLFLTGKIRFEQGRPEKDAAKKKGLMTEAKASLEKAIGNEPRMDLYYYYLGLVSGELSQSQEALAALAKAVVLNGQYKQYAEPDLDKFHAYYSRGKGTKKELDALKAKAKVELGIQ
ncbi:MAG: hypothetical protein ACR2L2_02015 [Acidobacteriota bacterium]